MYCQQNNSEIGKLLERNGLGKCCNDRRVNVAGKEKLKLKYINKLQGENSHAIVAHNIVSVLYIYIYINSSKRATQQDLAGSRRQLELREQEEAVR